MTRQELILSILLMKLLSQSEIKYNYDYHTASKLHSHSRNPGNLLHFWVNIDQALPFFFILWHSLLSNYGAKLTSNNVLTNLCANTSVICNSKTLFISGGMLKESSLLRRSQKVVWVEHSEQGREWLEERGRIDYRGKGW